jgi:hypothetical protein
MASRVAGSPKAVSGVAGLDGSPVTAGVAAPGPTSGIGELPGPTAGTDGGGVMSVSGVCGPRGRPLNIGIDGIAGAGAGVGADGAGGSPKNVIL